jgi:hypothetical protein
MAIDSKTREKLLKLFEGSDYRKVVSDRTNPKVHPNTVSNVLNNGTDNTDVELQLLIYAQELKAAKDADAEKRKKARAIAKQL